MGDVRAVLPSIVLLPRVQRTVGDVVDVARPRLRGKYKRDLQVRDPLVLLMSPESWCCFQQFSIRFVVGLSQCWLVLARRDQDPWFTGSRLRALVALPGGSHGGDGGLGGATGAVPHP